MATFLDVIREFVREKIDIILGDFNINALDDKTFEPLKIVLNSHEIMDNTTCPLNNVKKNKHKFYDMTNFFLLKFVLAFELHSSLSRMFTTNFIL